MNNFTEALLFTEDLFVDYMSREGVIWSPYTSGNTYRSHVTSKFTKDIGAAVSNFSRIQKEEMLYVRDHNGRPYLNMKLFERSYTPFDFLQYCGKMAYYALTAVKGGNDDFGDFTVLTVTKTLVSFMRSKEFEREGGWSRLQEMGRRCSESHVLQTIADISLQALY